MIITLFGGENIIFYAFVADNSEDYMKLISHKCR